MGAFVHGKWFCDEGCAEKDPDTNKMKELYTHGIEFKNEPINEEEEEVMGGAADDADIDL